MKAYWQIYIKSVNGVSAIPQKLVFILQKIRKPDLEAINTVMKPQITIE